jgi:hypothetical protein
LKWILVKNAWNASLKWTQQFGSKHGNHIIIQQVEQKMAYKEKKRHMVTKHITRFNVKAIGFHLPWNLHASTDVGVDVGLRRSWVKYRFNAWVKWAWSFLDSHVPSATNWSLSMCSLFFDAFRFSADQSDNKPSKQRVVWMGVFVFVVE